MFTGCIDAGVGHEQFNKLFSAMNLPIIHANTRKLAEQRVGKTIVSIAQESCVEGLFLFQYFVNKLSMSPFFHKFEQHF